MKISEQNGRIVGFQYDSNGFQFQVETYCADFSTDTYYFPFNQNRPMLFNLDDYRGKKIKVTVEMIED